MGPGPDPRRDRGATRDRGGESDGGAGAAAEQRVALQVQVGQLVKQALDQRRALLPGEAPAEVGPLAKGVQPNALLADELVFNVAFLLERQALPDFDAAIERLDAALAGCSRSPYRPASPYSFATVSVTRFDAGRAGGGPCRCSACRGNLRGGRAVELPAARPPGAPRSQPDRAQRGGTLRRAGAARADLLAYCRSRGRRTGPDGDSSLMVTIVRNGDCAAIEEGRDD